MAGKNKWQVIKSMVKEQEDTLEVFRSTYCDQKCFIHRFLRCLTAVNQCFISRGPWCFKCSDGSWTFCETYQTNTEAAAAMVGGCRSPKGLGCALCHRGQQQQTSGSSKKSEKCFLKDLSAAFCHPTKPIIQTKSDSELFFNPQIANFLDE